MEKRGQVTLFIIVGILIVSVVLIFFLLVAPRLDLVGRGELNFEGCVEDSLKESMIELEKTVGLGENGFSYSYLGQKIPYLCYTEEYYETCVVQTPFLVRGFEDALEEATREKIDLCYTNSINDLRSQGYDVSAGAVRYNLFLEPGIVRAEIEAPSRVGGSVFEKFRVEFSSPVYEMLILATSILQFEVTYGDSNVDDFKLLYPDFVFQKLKQGDGTTLYFIRHLDLPDEVAFASRSLVFPPGLG